jgi:transcriptional regulator with XRE-family HTH domain
MSTKTQAFGRALKKIRVRKKLTQESLSLQADLARVYISELEYGKKTPSIETVFKISKALNIKCSRLMDLTEEEFNA